MQMLRPLMVKLAKAPAAVPVVARARHLAHARLRVHLLLRARILQARTQAQSAASALPAVNIPAPSKLDNAVAAKAITVHASVLRVTTHVLPTLHPKALHAPCVNLVSPASRANPVATMVKAIAALRINLLVLMPTWAHNWAAQLHRVRHEPAPVVSLTLPVPASI